MTQPVQEPTQGRTDQAQGFQTRQLQRRPAPAGTGVVIWPTRYEGVGPALGLRMNTASDPWTIDATAPTGGYLQTTADGAQATYGVTLGPQDSDWELLVQYGKGSDYGIVEVILSSLLDPSIDPTRTTVIATIDCYDAAPSYVVAGSGTNQPNIIVDGIPGERLTTYVSPNMDGGPGYYELLFRTNGKNASSAGFRKRILAWSLQRRPLSGGDLWPVGYPPP